MILIGHLQVMDEPLSSLYADSGSGKYFIAVRLYEDCDDLTYLFLEVVPKSVLEYMGRQVGLNSILESSPSFYYRTSKPGHLKIGDLSPLTKEESRKRLVDEGVLDDMFNVHLAYRSVGLKNYLKQL